MTHHIEPEPVAQLVETYVEDELRDAEKFTNRTPLDDSGVWSLHQLAAVIYAAAWNDATRAANARNRGRHLRARAESSTEIGEAS